MTNERFDDEMLASMIREMPRADVPEGFADRVMYSLEPRRPSLWERLLLWMRRPITIRITPVRVIPAMAVAALLMVLALPMQQMMVSPDSSGAVPVRFVLGKNVDARQVAVIGSFNNWSPDEAAMRYDKSLGAWVADLELPPGTHEYVFLVDGERVVADPVAPLSRDDGFGNRNSVLYLTGDHEQSL